MSFLRSSIARSAVFRPTTTRPFHSAPTLRAQADYGSGDGHPAAEKPQQQGKNPREDLEHPGPKSPASGKGNASSGGKSSGGDGKKAVETDKDVKGVKGAKPKIHSEGAPKEQSADVKRHNEEMNERADKAHERSE